MRLPNPLVSRGEPEAPARPPLPTTTRTPVAFEILRERDATLRFVLGAPDRGELDLAFQALRTSFPGVELGQGIGCPQYAVLSRPRRGLYRAVACAPSHVWPFHRAPGGADPAGLLVRLLASPRLGRRRVAVQFLFRTVRTWERSWFGSRFEDVVDAMRDPALKRTLEAREAEPPFHLEIRTAVEGDDGHLAARAVDVWLGNWRVVRGGAWRNLAAPRFGHPARALSHALGHHRLDQAVARKGRRDVSASDLALLLPIPWRERHVGVTYAGAPAGGVPKELASTPGSSRTDLILGGSGDTEVRLPPAWNHLAILGRTRTGKSTLARSVVLQLLAKRPDARVIVLEPTGELIDGIVGGISPEVATDTVAIDPARAAFEADGEERVAVPLNLLALPPPHANGGPAERARRSERLAGDVVAAIKNAWGEESVGGRADFILRSVVQGLSAVEGTNVVDAFTVLSDRNALRRLERIAGSSPLGRTLGTHLPRLDYSVTISSLDKLGKIATNPLLRRTLAQRYGAVGFDRLLEHRLLLLNLGKGALGAEGANFLGAILLSQLWSALQDRTAGSTNPIYLVVDEFPNYAIPAFADLLSEGARLGLHVVAITQYLARVPERIRAALVGNVDAWAVFPIGAEDVRPTFGILQGPRFGWTHDDLAGGLEPHSFALKAGDALIRVDPWRVHASPPPGPENRTTVDRSTRRYAASEDSEESPLQVSTDQMERMLGEFPSEGDASVEGLSGRLGAPGSVVRAALAYAVASGDVSAEEGGRLRVTARGRFHREALRVARNEGEEHSDLLADALAFLDGLGIVGCVGVQLGAAPTPDATFEVRGVEHHLEVECSTLVKHHEQVVRNVRKATAAGRRCLVVVADRESADRFLRILRVKTPEIELWRQVGLAWRAGPGVLVPSETGLTPVWPWLLGEVGGEDDFAGRAVTSEPPAIAVASHAERDRETVAAVGSRIARLGNDWATAADLRDSSGEPSLRTWREERIGRVLASLGVPNRRVRSVQGQRREYYIAGLANSPSPDGSRPSGDRC